MPILKNGTQWLTDPKTKADTFAQVFASKPELPAEIGETPYFGLTDAEFYVFLTFRSRNCKRLLKGLDVNKATGHDQVSAAILKKLCDCLAVPFTLVCRRLLYEGCWPK